MEIERKFLIKKESLPQNYNEYTYNELEQAYIITNPVLRIRKKDNEYILTYKGPGFLARQEEEFPLTKESYEKLLTKAEGITISKTRYKIPHDDLVIELDIFKKDLDGLILAEVEFPDMTAANEYVPPEWFGREVTNEGTYHNSSLSSLDKDELIAVLKAAQS